MVGNELFLVVRVHIAVRQDCQIRFAIESDAMLYLFEVSALVVITISVIAFGGFLILYALLTAANVILQALRMFYSGNTYVPKMASAKSSVRAA